MSNSKRPGGPGGPIGMRKGPKAKNPMKTLKRIFAIIVKGYPIQCVLVIIGIVVGVLANVSLTRVQNSIYFSKRNYLLNERFFRQIV